MSTRRRKQPTYRESCASISRGNFSCTRPHGHAGRHENRHVEGGWTDPALPLSTRPVGTVTSARLRADGAAIRLRQWSKNVNEFGPDIGQWGDRKFVAAEMNRIAELLEELGKGFRFDADTAVSVDLADALVNALGRLLSGHDTDPDAHQYVLDWTAARVAFDAYRGVSTRPVDEVATLKTQVWVGSATACPDGAIPDGETCPACHGRRFRPHSSPAWIHAEHAARGFTDDVVAAAEAYRDSLSRNRSAGAGASRNEQPPPVLCARCECVHPEGEHRNEQPQGGPGSWSGSPLAKALKALLIAGCRTYWPQQAQQADDALRWAEGQDYLVDLACAEVLAESRAEVAAEQSVPAAERALWVEYCGLLTIATQVEKEWEYDCAYARTRERRMAEIRAALDLDEQNRDVRA